MTKLCMALVAGMIGYSTAAVAVEPMYIACSDDYYRYCPTVQPGGGRIVACLSNKKITNACRLSMAKWVAETKANAH
jgi:Cysteine rich repeat